MELHPADWRPFHARCVQESAEAGYASYEANEWCTTDGGCLAREQIHGYSTCCHEEREQHRISGRVEGIDATGIDADGWKLMPGG